LLNTLRVASFNLHKGVTHFNTRFALHHQRHALAHLNADIVFLQEVRDVHAPHAKRFTKWPQQGQMHFLSQNLWPHTSYGQNAFYPSGHHGNAILSKFPLQTIANTNISAHRIEQRGLLHCKIAVPHWDQPLHAFCLHLGLLAKWRQQQIQMVADYIEQAVPNHHSPIIVAGDFNDWSTRSGEVMASRLNLLEAFKHANGKHARSFPAFFPLLKLDRIYVRGFDIVEASTHSNKRLLNDSDHMILSSTLIKHG
jgi:endonuclease/exonuclease/phosphatase family metal-dependent hydrolase